MKVRVSHSTQISTSNFVAVTSSGSSFISVGAKMCISASMTVQRRCKIAAENSGRHQRVKVTDVFDH